MAVRKLQCVLPAVRSVKTGIATALPKQTKTIYLSPEWRGLMSRLLARRGQGCEACGRTGCRIFGDHIHELKDGGAPLDPGNIRLLCGSCHSTKTARVRAIRTRETPTR
ncbi:HNH endonuclease signature motif containing protein [Asaia lannensis]|uniref:HNH endonuclease n=1 Tax=Asaia lannensis NBRC 102526 TaxID=1307926 RepID=A0ABT1CJW1_9PROT|nr:HNH endonuclease signature motif containing protein [Asaia lannensis]MCO6161046.1 HNH endonuclease [Asaia lannensis NBRC 102526]GBQ95438.1 endonuclease [Asaia lannensis NBRC 102526]